MNPKTYEFLHRLEQIDWFCNAGKPLDESPNCFLVRDWQEALKICASESSEAAYLEASNELTIYLSKHHGEAYSLWNSKVGEIKPVISRLIEKKMAMPAVHARIPSYAGKTFADTLSWDLVALCMACEYENYVRTKYYGLLGKSYMDGRFPCGWVGEVPDDFLGAFEVGRLAIL